MSRIMRLPMYVVDAFASRPFSGNPAAVCLCMPGVLLDDKVRQRIAAEMNHSETAFIEPLDGSSSAAAGRDEFSSASAFRLRWFTPTCEVPCCGHATLASAAVLFQARNNPHPAISFHTLSGELVVSRAASATPPADPAADDPSSSPPPPPLALSLTLPLYDPVDPVPACAADPRGPLARACAGSLPVAEVRYCGAGGLNYVLMALAEGVGRRQLEALRPDFEAMGRAAPAEEVHGVIVCVRTGSDQPSAEATAEVEGEEEVCSRFFAPWMGINEDPVTGSAHAVLGPYWEATLRPAGKGGSGSGGVGRGGGRVGPMRMRQCSARGGDVLVEVMREEGRVRVSGTATLVLEGTLRL
ncbi:hypothetical protein PLESTB_001495800 [Pleodorina starrii]|uniref:Uncharacterized protein n=1 Tax=Pleodorina starrii TaxID=330485 RepID=A0A9W6F7P0_9CHLO|nr:hypothetical protein PLESTM_001448700 [Pleodorina starrii]GLC59517.1 hypothetical protein PLESTB_001495800 [Pleodorina starrii]GLC66279.1 hypothetical protein PLESTF_000406900 [Pleodorina starrii]